MNTLSRPKDIDDYISRFPPETQKALTLIRRTIRKCAPEAVETISYGIPTFTRGGTYLVYFAGYKNHVSVYPAPRGKEPFTKILAPYKGGKGTVQFPLGKPVPTDLITKIVKFRIGENEAKRKKSAAKKTPLKKGKS